MPEFFSRLFTPQTIKADAIAGVTVLFITLPQVIAYAFLAGMPAQAGLYAALVALCLYAFMGTSKVLVVGPTAIVAMMTLQITSPFAEIGSTQYIASCTTLALLTGGVLCFLRAIRFGYIINLLSHAVVAGFITAAAVLIIGHQFPTALGLQGLKEMNLTGQMIYLAGQLTDINTVALAISLGSLVFLVLCKFFLSRWLVQAGIKPANAEIVTKSAPMLVVLLTIFLSLSFQFKDQFGVEVVGTIPSGMPELSLLIPSLDEAIQLLPGAFLIALIIFLESTSIGSVMASKQRQRIEPNQELLALGIANLGVAAVSGFPVAGSFARTAVNFASGAVSQLACVITAFFLGITLLWFADWFFALPTAVLSAIVIISAAQLIDIARIRELVRYSFSDAITFAGTFVMVIALGVEAGIVCGVILSIMFLLRRNSRPHIAEVGRLSGTEHFRNIHRFEVETFSNLLLLRVDESLIFANARYVESFVYDQLAGRAAVTDVVLICTATNFIDVTGLLMLDDLNQNLSDTHITMHLAEIKGPVMAQLENTSFMKDLTGELFLTADLALKALTER